MDFEFRSSNDKVVLSSLDSNCTSCISKCISESQITICSFSNKKKRQGKKSNLNGSVYICSDSIDLINSSRLFKEKLTSRIDLIGFLSQVSSQIEERNQKQVKRLIHNLTTLNAHCLQEIYSLSPQEDLAETKQDQRAQLLEKYISEDTSGAANTFSRILKNNTLMKVEFAVFNKLYETQPRLDKRSHQIRKVVLNVLHVFFPDFTDKEVEVIVEGFDEKIVFDYESITVVLMHLVENATKYICPKTKLIIKFKGDTNEVKILFDMISLKITDSERENIFEEGFSGKVPSSLGLSGKGIGLFLVKQLLKINHGNIMVQNSVDSKRSTRQMGVEFENNLFTISLPR